MLFAGSSAWESNEVHAITSQGTVSAHHAAPISSDIPAADVLMLRPNALSDEPYSRQLPLEHPREGNGLPLPHADHGETAGESQAASEGNASTSNVHQKMARPRLRLKWQLTDKTQPHVTAVAKQKSILSRIFRGDRSVQP